MPSGPYDPKFFTEDHVYDAPGLLGWLTRKRKAAVLSLLRNVLAESGSFRIIDVGCGYGDMLNELRYPFRIGVDINIDSLVEARARNSVPAYVLSGVDRLPFSSCSFDGVICSEVLEHLENPENLALEIHRITKIGGYYCITVPNENITTIGRFLLGKRPSKSPAHKQSFSLSGLMRLFSDRPVKKIMVPYNFAPFALSTNVVMLFQKNSERLLRNCQCVS
jgi:SAM-dependent methyltransferase